MARARLLALVLLMLPVAAHAGRFELLSRSGMESETAENRRYDPYNPAGDNNRPAISADGRWVAFTGFYRNLVPGQQDTGTFSQVFLHDRQTGTTVLASHAASSVAVPGTLASDLPSISADGRWVLYESQADNLVPGAATPYKQLFLFDRNTGTNQLVSRSANGAGNLPSNHHATDSTISADGEWIAFASEANDLLPGLVDPDGIDVFLFERATGQMTLVSRAYGTSTTAANFGSWQPSLSADGRYVAFTSDATDMIPVFTGTLRNVFLFDRVSGAMTLASHASASPTSGATGTGPTISPDGTAVAFYSTGTNLVAGQADSNGWEDVFLFDRLTGTNVLVSRSSASPTTTGNSYVRHDLLRLTAGGAYVAFAGYATNAVPGQVDVNALLYDNADVFLFERATSSLALVSRSTASATTTANQGSALSALAEDGSFVVFETAATDVIAGQSDANGTTDVFLFDRATGARTLVSGSGATTGDAGSRYATVSADGSAVAFWSLAGNLVPGGVGDRNSDYDVILYERNDGTLSAATPQAPGLPSATPGASSIVTSVSADGRYAVLLSLGLNLVAGQVDDNLGTDVFLVDRVAGTTTLVSRSVSSGASATTAPTTGNGPSDSPAISADGAFVTFISRATDLVPGQVDTNQQQGLPGFDVFLYERATGTVTLVSHAAGSPATAGDLSCEAYLYQGINVPIAPSISADGRYIAYLCNATNLVPAQVDINATLADVFLYDRVSGGTILVSRKYGSAAATAGQGSESPRISADGRYVAFSSAASDILPQNDANNAADVFLFDRVADQMLLVSRQAGTADTTADHPSVQPSLTPDGHYVAFISAAGNLVPGQVDAGIDYDVFLFDRVTGTVELISRANGSATNAANAGASEPVVSGDGRFVAFLSSSSDLVPGLSQPAGLQVFVHDRVLR
ncbi:MAG TPA: hypothetical protein VHK64_06685, partial [Nocardioidaceae bacterium]|nr:hypothetical protein [Nocardioidaceae bacterium]